MPQKRKRSQRPPPVPEPENVDKSNGKLKRLTTYEDVADSEDEFFINKDKILLEETTGRGNLYGQDDYLELSDEEVLRDEESSDESESEGYQKEQTKQSASRRSGGVPGDRSVDTGDERATDEDDGLETWGGSKRDYYNQEEIETERDALEEEEEARRLQQKRLKKRSEADFGFDDTTWLVDGASTERGDGDGADGRAVTEVLPHLKITDEMGVEERIRLLDLRHPEFGPLSKEFIELQPLHAELSTAFSERVLPAKGDSEKGPDVLSLKYHALTAYLGALSMYFAFLTSGADGSKDSMATAPSDLRDHPIMESLLECRQLWDHVKDVIVPEPVEEIVEEVIKLSAPGELVQATDINGHAKMDKNESTKLSRKRKRRSALEAAQAEAEQRLAEKIKKTEEELAGLSTLTSQLKARSAQASRDNVTRVSTTVDGETDFAEDTVLHPVEAAEKARKKKTLRFYTSQITQKANRRSNAGRDAGGDADLPYRERLKDRQARLNAQAEKRGMRSEKDDATEALGGASDEEGDSPTIANKDRKGNGGQEEDDEYYGLIAAAKKKRKAAKEASYQASLANGAQQTYAVAEEETIGPDGKRAINYQIEKNKGLTPKRKKDVRNPRVKKRKKFAEKQKKLGSVRQVYRGGEQRGGYAGEATGIKTRLVKSVKL